MPSKIVAAELLNTQGALHLMEDLKKARKEEVEIDASSVRHLGAQALQILLSAKRTWDSETRSFVIKDPSPDFSLGLKALGGNELLEMGPAA